MAFTALQQSITSDFPSLSKSQVISIAGLVESGFSMQRAADQLGIEIPELAAVQQTVREQKPRAITTTPTATTAPPPPTPTPAPTPATVAAPAPAPAPVGTALNPEVLSPAPATPAPVPQQPVFNAPPIPGPGTGFQVDPRDSEKVLASLAQFVNAMFGAQQPGLVSGQFTNPNQVAGGLQNQFTNTVQGPQQFQDFINQLSGFGTGSPLGDTLSQSLQGQIGGTDPQLQALMSTLFGQPAVQSLSTGRASQGLDALNQQVSGQGFGGGFQDVTGQPTTAGGVSQELLGQPAIQSLSTGRASRGLQDLSGRDPLGAQLGGRASQFLNAPLSSRDFGDLQGIQAPQLALPQTQPAGFQGPTAVGAPGIQGSAQDVIQGNLTGGLTQAFRDAQRRQVFEPSQERLLGQLNQLGGGVGALGSGLPAEFLRRNEQDFQDRLTNFGFQAQQAAIPQATQLGGQQFGQGFANQQLSQQAGQAQAGFGQQANLANLQAQLQTQGLGSGQHLQAQLANLGAAQGQQQFDLNALLQQAQIGGGFQGQLFQQPFGVAQAQGQLGQTQQQINQQAIGLGFQGQNQGFNQILQTLLAQGNLGQQQQQINQQAFGIGGQLQNQLAQQGLQGTQLGLGREQFQGEFQQQNTAQALQFLQLMNLFGLGQTDIASANARQILGGAQIASPKGSFLNALVAGGATVASAFAPGQ